MSEKTVLIRSFEIHTATPDDWREINRLANLRQAMILPDDPQIPLDYTIRSWSSTPPVVRDFHWLAWTETGDLIGRSELSLLDLPENLHMAQGVLYVLPEYRRQGVGKRLLAPMVEKALEDGRRIFITEAVERDPVGLEFSQHVGGKVALAAHVNQLRLADVDRVRIHEWIARAYERAEGYALEFIDGPYPEVDLEEVAVLMGAMNQAPRGDIDMKDIEYTPDLLKQIDASMKDAGQGRWTFVAREIATGHLAGVTDVIWSPAKPNIGMISTTGVLELYRNKGLGRWLKAAMLEKILTEKPEVKFIRTGNADVNAPMLKINNELGFQPYQSTSVIQVNLEDLKGYLGKK